MSSANVCKRARSKEEITLSGNLSLEDQFLVAPITTLVFCSSKGGKGEEEVTEWLVEASREGVAAEVPLKFLDVGWHALTF